MNEQSPVARALMDRLPDSRMTGAQFREIRFEIGRLLGTNVNQPDLVPLIHRSRENISRYENDHAPIQPELAILLRLVVRELRRQNDLEGRVEMLERQLRESHD